MSIVNNIFAPPLRADVISLLSVIIWPQNMFLQPLKKGYPSSALIERWESKGAGQLKHRDTTVLAVVLNFTDITTQKREIKWNGVPHPFFFMFQHKVIESGKHHKWRYNQI